MLELAIQTANSSVVDLRIIPTGLQATSTGAWSFHSKASGKTRQFDLKDILNASYNLPDSRVTIRLLIHSKNGVSLPSLEGTVQKDQSETAQAFCNELIKRAYDPVRPYRRLKVILNPNSGGKKARRAWITRLEPLFVAAGCQVDFQQTERPGHAIEIARQLDIAKFDALVLVSGDGLVHEVCNGLATRSDALDALQLPIGIIPAGTSNGLAICVTSPAEARSMVAAALTILKGGSPLTLDLSIVTQQDKTWYSFLTQAFGLLADCDIGTDDLRWMGPQRVIYGFVKTVLSGKIFPCDIWLKNAESDRTKMKQAALAAPVLRDAPFNPDQRSLSPRFGSVNDDLAAQDGWTKMEAKTLKSFYAGLIPYVDSTYMPFPTARADGLINIHMIPKASKMSILKAMDGSDNGSHYDKAPGEFLKCEAYRLVPHSKKNWLAIDGESVPCAPIQVECLKGMLRVLSLHSTFYAPKKWQGDA